MILPTRNKMGNSSDDYRGGAPDRLSFDPATRRGGRSRRSVEGSLRTGRAWCCRSREGGRDGRGAIGRTVGDLGDGSARPTTAGRSSGFWGRSSGSVKQGESGIGSSTMTGIAFFWRGRSGGRSRGRGGGEGGRSAGIVATTFSLLIRPWCDDRCDQRLLQRVVISYDLVDPDCELFITNYDVPSEKGE